MPKAWLIGGAVFLVALLVASVIVALLDSEETQPEGTPERALQLFLDAVRQDDFELAYSFLSEELKEECTVEEFVGGNFPKRDHLRDDRVTLESTATVKETVFVTVRVTQFRGSGPFGTSESSFEQRFALRQKEGQWRFTEYPWPFFRCGPFEPVRPTPEPSSTHTPSPVPAS
jgi:hypothetical protein